MKRLTSDNVFEMDMVQLALNQVYIKDGWAWYRNGPEDELSVCDLLRSAAETLGVELPILDDDSLSDLLADWLQYGAGEPEGVLAILYRTLWAMAEVRAKLSRYENTGLEPEEIKEAQEAMSPVLFGRFHDIMEAERNGRLVVLLEPNAPLTLDELRKMDREPVWIERCGSDSPDDREWALVDLEYEMCRTTRGGLAVFEMYGKTWLAYRRKLEEDQS